MKTNNSRGSHRSYATMACLLIASALGAGSSDTFAQAPGEPSAVASTACDRACLLGFVHSYLDAVAHKDRARAKFSPAVRFTENNVEMPLGNDGVWASLTRVAATGLEVADTLTGNAAWFGTIEEHGAPAYYAMRLKVRDGQITEVETVVDRKTPLPAPFGDPDKLVHDPSFNDVLPEEQQRPRERLIAVANGYFSTVELNDGQIFTHFDPDCQRIEDGVSTTSGSAGSASIAQGCEAQFKLGIYRINKRVRERRYELVDTERGIVVGTGFFDHANAFDSYETTDGVVRKTLLKWPNSLSLMEAFKIKDGRIYRVEAVFTYVPYFMHSPWTDPPRTAPPGAAVARSKVAHTDCNRDCLIQAADGYMEALVAKDPARVHWAPAVRYTENSVSMMIGDGVWGAISSKSATPLHAADPASGNVAWFGLVEEHGSPAYYGMRLKVEGGKVSEVEAVIARKPDPSPFGDPAKYVHDPAFGEVLPSAQRVSRQKLIAAVTRTSLDPQCARTENGISSAQGCSGAAADRLRARRFPVVDEERGVVVAAAYVDHTAHADGPVKYPNSLGRIEMFKVVNGRIYRVEAIFTTLPYFMTSAWGN